KSAHVVAVKAVTRLEAREEKTGRYFEEAVAPTRCAEQRRSVGTKTGELAMEIRRFGARLIQAETARNVAAPSVLACRIIEVDRLDAGGKATEIRSEILAYPA